MKSNHKTSHVVIDNGFGRVTDTSQLRTEITITVVDQYADQIYQETRFVDVDTDMVHVEDADLAFPGGVSPKLIDLGLKHWLDDLERYL